MKYLIPILVIASITAFAAEKKRAFMLVGPCPKDGKMITNAVPFKVTSGWEHTDGTNIIKSEILWFKCPRDGTKFPLPGEPKISKVPRTYPPIP